MPTDRQRAVARGEVEAEPATDPAIAELLALVREPSGVSIETLLKVLALSSRQAVIAAKQDDKLRVDMNVGQITEKLDSMVGSATRKRRVIHWAQVAGLVIASALAAGQALWNIVAPEARAAAEVAVIAPAIEAKRVAEVAADRADTHAARLDAIERSHSELAASVERLNGAVVALTDRLPPPPPTRIDVVTDASQPRPKRPKDKP